MKLLTHDSHDSTKAKLGYVEEFMDKYILKDQYGIMEKNYKYNSPY
ncbi:hypothetical protein TOT_010001177 [Theileria orientalis strain Shintoku]|uniref:Uncharacterized protein n=1 Tax=Theileria orientalis strain Shintoku TaxID=869250 RepID=J4C7W0_THEOR|nr:hypothetical protein TOT_010001177 [Theileria orientalis strain Shintoku]PVC49638.1 hypothetical protein MACL_00002849 [Theileria orientalis]BAM39723.1 hypothetical protein TOT_010001177 [Theileria orientalis strain Shintoku]|eukprot:XP_009690024.1 hypothetical protein TOT_010001177 [Theileria orientalis strain Shintoku]